MVPYAEWELPEEILEKYRQTTAASKIAKYIKEEGHEPESVVPFFELSDVEIETIKRRAYAEFEVEEFYTPIDLSLYDENRVLRAYGQTTANSYIVKTAGTYLIPLVYGNAISKGVTNSAAYTNIGGTYTHDFVNHLNAVITSPFIEQHVDCAASGAELTIADTDGVFANVKLVNGSPCRYIQFTVKEVPLTNANGVISVLGKNNIVMWSWFICVRGGGISVSEYTNREGLNLKLMDFALGDLYDNDGTHTKNWLWQWGRPIPQICPEAYNSNTNHQTYSSTGKIFSTSSAASTIGEALQHPERFFNGNASSMHKWYTGDITHYNLWDASCNSDGLTTDSVKSVYDPCPPGFKVPVGKAFTYFGYDGIINAVDEFDYGWKFKRDSSDTEGRFYPASGYRMSGGLLNYVGTIAYYWSSASYSQTNAHNLTFHSNSVGATSYSLRAYGNSIRAQQES